MKKLILLKILALIINLMYLYIALLPRLLNFIPKKNMKKLTLKDLKKF